MSVSTKPPNGKVPTPFCLLRGMLLLDYNAPNLTVIWDNRFESSSRFRFRASNSALKCVEAVLQTIVHIVDFGGAANGEVEPEVHFELVVG
jgi:hypothetical protein